MDSVLMMRRNEKCKIILYYLHIRNVSYKIQYFFLIIFFITLTQYITFSPIYIYICSIYLYVHSASMREVVEKELTLYNNSVNT